MSKSSEKDLLASKWKFAKQVFRSDIYAKFRTMQIDAYNFEMALKSRSIKLQSFEYYVEGKSLFFDISIHFESIKLFYADAWTIWSIPREDMPTHRNDYWNNKRQAPEVSSIHRDVANGNLVLTIKLNPNSKRYFYPSPMELSQNDSLVTCNSQKYYEVFLK